MYLFLMILFVDHPINRPSPFLHSFPFGSCTANTLSTWLHRWPLSSISTGSARSCPSTTTAGCLPSNTSPPVAWAGRSWPPLPDRNLKQTFLNYRHRLADFIKRDDPEENCKHALKINPHEISQRVVDGYPPNRVLGQPHIHPDNNKKTYTRRYNEQRRRWVSN